MTHTTNTPSVDEVWAAALAGNPLPGVQLVTVDYHTGEAIRVATLTDIGRHQESTDYDCGLFGNPIIWLDDGRMAMVEVVELMDAHHHDFVRMVNGWLAELL